MNRGLLSNIGIVFTIALTTFLLIIPQALAVESTLTPTQDNTLNEGAPTTNYGTLTGVSLRRTVTQRQRIVMGFDTPINMTEVSSASLELYFYNKFGSPTHRVVWTYALQDSAITWTELGSTWNNYKAVTAWNTAGGDYALTGAVSATIPAINNWMSFDVTDLVNSYLSNGSTIMSFFLKLELEDALSEQSQFYSRNYSDPTLTPRLTLLYNTSSNSGVVGGLPNSDPLDNVTATGKTSFIYVSKIPNSVYINDTSFTIDTYENDIGDTHITVMLYSASMYSPISLTNPLKAIWTKDIIIENATYQHTITFHPHISTPQNSYIAIGLSSSEDIILNASDTTQQMYSYPAFAPYAIEKLYEETDKIGLYFLWGYTLSDTVVSAFSTTNFVTDYDIIGSINALAGNIGMPSLMIYGIIFFITLLGIIIGLSVAQKNSSENSTLPPVILGVFGFSVLTFFSVTNMLPFELLIFGVIAVITIFALMLTKTFLGNDQ